MIIMLAILVFAGLFIGFGGQHMLGHWEAEQEHKARVENTNHL